MRDVKRESSFATAVPKLNDSPDRGESFKHLLHSSTFMLGLSVFASYVTLGFITPDFFVSLKGLKNVLQVKLNDLR